MFGLDVGLWRALEMPLKVHFLLETDLSFGRPARPADSAFQNESWSESRSEFRNEFRSEPKSELEVSPEVEALKTEA